MKLHVVVSCVCLTALVGLAMPAWAIDASFVLDESDKTSKVFETSRSAASGHAQVLANLAVFNALNTIEPRYQSYHWSAAPEPKASPEAAVLTANATILANFARIDASQAYRDYKAAIGAIPDGPAKDAGVLLGRRAALAILQDRIAAWPGKRVEPIPYVAGPGVYSLTPGYPRQVGMEMGQAKPFAIDDIDSVDPGPPPPVGSAQYLRELAEVKRDGGATSTTRTSDQAQSAIYWNSSGPNQGEILKKAASDRSLSALAMARVLAQFSMADYDAGIAVNRFKHKYNRWRPYHAIRDQATAGAHFDANWQPLLRTHPHQDYPSAGRTFGQVFASMLESLGVTRIESLNEETEQTRAWASPQAMSDDLGDARVWAGVHFRSASDSAGRLGKAVWQKVSAEQLRPLN